MLMQAGIPYDSDQGRSICGMLSSIMTGRSYRQSALLAAEHGAFRGYDDDRENMLRVIRNHRRAAHGVSRDAKEWESLRTRPVPIDHDIVTNGNVPIANARNLLDRAALVWDDALELGMEHGYRNAQVTVIAPTGTIGLLMDCDTTGVEPDFALVKFKKLAGGGYFKIVNASVEPALQALGYSEEQIRLIITSIIGTLSLAVPMPEGAPGADEDKTLAEFLMDKGLQPEHLTSIEEALPGAFELSFAFSAWSLGDDVLTAAGVDPERAKADQSFNLLKHLELSNKQIEELNRLVCGRQTIEGAPGFDDAHLAVFDCANHCGPLGTRIIRSEGHIRMMAAAQPFISGAISKTINLPNEATVDDIKDCYRLSWELGLKANALYRDGCKLSQPLSAKKDADLDEEDADELDIAEAKSEVASSVVSLADAISGTDSAKVEVEKAKIVHRPMRRRLPVTRESVTHKFNVAGHEGYLTVGLYEDGMPGELFITMAKEGSTIGGLMDSLGTAVSVALQYGVPVQSLVTKFTHQRFEPAGMTANKDIPFAKSLVDYIFRWLGMRFIPGYREANLPHRPTKSPAATDQTASRKSAAPATGSTGGDSRWTTQKQPAAGDSGNGSDRKDSGPIGRIGATTTKAVAVSATTEVISETKGDVTTVVVEEHVSALSAAMSENMGDSPPCDVCGEITVRNGTCYKCMGCGNSMGCS